MPPPVAETIAARLAEIGRVTVPASDVAAAIAWERTLAYGPDLSVIRRTGL